MSRDQSIRPIAYWRRDQRANCGESGPKSSQVTRRAQHCARLDRSLVARDPQHRFDALEMEMAAQFLAERRVACHEQQLVTALVTQDELHRAAAESAGAVVHQKRRRSGEQGIGGEFGRRSLHTVVDEPQRHRAAERVGREIRLSLRLCVCGDGSLSVLVRHSTHIDEPRRHRDTKEIDLPPGAKPGVLGQGCGTTKVVP